MMRRRNPGAGERRPRTTLEWTDPRDRLILNDLNRFKGRAIGRRLKELLAIGLEAERLGMRAVEVEGVLVGSQAGNWPNLTGRTLSPPSSHPEELHPTAQALQGAATAEARSAETAPPIDEDHRRGLESMLQSIGM